MDFQKWSKFSVLFVSSIIYLKPDALYAQKMYFLQAGSYFSEKQAFISLDKFHKKLKLSGKVHHQIINGKAYYQVWLGPYERLPEAQVVEHQIHQLGRSAFIRAIESSVPVRNSSPKSVLKQNKINSPSRKTIFHPKRDKVAYIRPSFNVINLNNEPNPSVTPSSFINLIPGSYRARGILDGTLGTKRNFGDAEFLKPIWSLANGFIYTDAAGKYGNDDAWFLSGGLGTRTLFHDVAVVGGYVFADYNRSNRDKDFWIINPGLEYMNINWDGAINAYIPVSARQQSFGIMPGFRAGIESTRFSNHFIFEDYYNILDTTGAGVDGEIGYTFNNQFYNTRAFVGSYYFSPKSYSDFVGIEGGVEIPLSERFKVVIHDAYDRVQGNTFMGTLRVTLDGNPPTTALNNRLFDPIRRHLGAQQTGSGVPIIQVNKFVEQRVIDANAWFFSPNGTVFNIANAYSNCTFEHPCSQFSQDAITGINGMAPSASLLLNTGTYLNPSVGTGLTLFNGQQVLGRMDNFKHPASNFNRPFINDTLILSGNNNLANLQINGNTTIANDRVGVNILAGVTTPVYIDNSLITASVDGLAINSIGVQSINNRATLTITRSEITSTISGSTGFEATGLSLENAGNLLLFNSSVSATSTNSNGAKGVYMNATSGNILFSSINLLSNFGQAIALDADGAYQINVLNSKIQTTVENNTLSTNTAYAIYNANSLINILGSEVTITGNNYTSNGIVALNTTSGGTTTTNGASINVNAINSGNYVAGVNIGEGAVSMVSSTINLNLNNTGITSNNYGINGGASSSINLDKVNIRAIGQNLTSHITGLEYGGALTYRDIGILVVNSPGAAYVSAGSGSVVSFGTSFCVGISNGYVMSIGCPPTT